MFVYMYIGLFMYTFVYIGKWTPLLSQLSIHIDFDQKVLVYDSASDGFDYGIDADIYLDIDITISIDSGIDMGIDLDTKIEHDIDMCCYLYRQRYKCWYYYIQLSMRSRFH